jgi:hypothetical protein
MMYGNPLAQIDEEWASAGLRELERYLQKYADFEEYCRRRMARHPAGA